MHVLVYINPESDSNVTQVIAASRSAAKLRKAAHLRTDSIDEIDAITIVWEDTTSHDGKPMTRGKIYMGLDDIEDLKEVDCGGAEELSDYYEIVVVDVL